MEQHPVPQNVTGFQFKLIGDITLKQFAYLAICFILAYFSTKFILIPSILQYPVAGFFVLLGFGLAFVPIEERPLDRWLTSFIKSIYSPTQFVWRKNNTPPEVLLSALSPMQPAAPQPAIPVTAPTKTDDLTREYTTSLIKSAPVKVNHPVVKPNIQPAPPPLKTPIPPKTPNQWTIGAPPPKSKSVAAPSASSASITGKRIIFEEKPKPSATTDQTAPKDVQKITSDYKAVTDKLKEQLSLMQKELEQGSVAKDRFMELQQTLTLLMNEKDRLNQELISLKQKLSDSEKSPTVSPSGYVQAPQDTRHTVKMVSPASASQMGIPTLTTQPNVITGIIKDSKSNLLPNLIVMVKDKEGIPVRALKTNKLGQFAASTPLTSGVYFIELEDPKKMFQFNRIEVTLSGQVLPPLEVSAISERDLMRQKLNRELFGKNNI